MNQCVYNARSEANSPTNTNRSKVPKANLFGDLPQHIDLPLETSVYRGSVQLSENAKAHVLNGLPSRSRGHG
jgi:hypothetical protein